MATSMAKRSAGAPLSVPVVSEGRLRGLLRLEDFDKWLALHSGATATT